MHRRSFLALTLAAIPGAARGETSLVSIARQAVMHLRPDASATERVEAVVGWTNRNLEWTVTDYQARTAEEVLQRGGGNCAEQAMVVSALLAPLGVRTRVAREINIQPPNPDRQERAARLVETRGPRLSVFGLRHNDHAWIEFENLQENLWIPADPTLDLVGVEAWTNARLGFGERPRHAILPSRDMLAPIFVAARTASDFEPRSRSYLIDGFARVVPQATATAEWGRWCAAVTAFETEALGAFRGQVNLHRYDERIAELGLIYEAMRASVRSGQGLPGRSTAKAAVSTV